MDDIKVLPFAQLIAHPVAGKTQADFKDRPDQGRPADLGDPRPRRGLSHDRYFFLSTGAVAQQAIHALGPAQRGTRRHTVREVRARDTEGLALGFRDAVCTASFLIMLRVSDYNHDSWGLLLLRAGLWRAGLSHGRPALSHWRAGWGPARTGLPSTTRGQCCTTISTCIIAQRTTHDGKELRINMARFEMVFNAMQGLLPMSALVGAVGALPSSTQTDAYRCGGDDVPGNDCSIVRRGRCAIDRRTLTDDPQLTHNASPVVVRSDEIKPATKDWSRQRVCSRNAGAAGGWSRKARRSKRPCKETGCI